MIIKTTIIINWGWVLLFMLPLAPTLFSWFLPALALLGLLTAPILSAQCQELLPLSQTVSSASEAQVYIPKALLILVRCSPDQLLVHSFFLISSLPSCAAVCPSTYLDLCPIVLFSCTWLSNSYLVNFPWQLMFLQLTLVLLPEPASRPFLQCLPLQ